MSIPFDRRPYLSAISTSFFHQESSNRKAKMKTILLIVFCCSILLQQGALNRGPTSADFCTVATLPIQSSFNFSMVDAITCFSCLPVFKDCADDFGDMGRCETEGYCSKLVLGNTITRQCLPSCAEGKAGGASVYCCRSNLCNSGIQTSSSTLVPLLTALVTVVLLLGRERF